MWRGMLDRKVAAVSCIYVYVVPDPGSEAESHTRTWLRGWRPEQGGGAVLCVSLRLLPAA